MKARSYANTHSQIVCQNLRAIRTSRRMSVQQVADAMTADGLMISRTVLAKIDLGLVEVVTVDLAFGIARLFGMTLDELIIRPVCEVCVGSPPLGFTCNNCGARKAEASAE